MERYKSLIEIATDLFEGRIEETKELITTDDIRSKVYKTYDKIDELIKKDVGILRKYLLQ